MIKYSTLRYKAFLQFALFVITTGLLAYFSGTQRWLPFWVAAIVAAAIFGLLAYLDSAGFRTHLRDLEEREFRLASRFEQCGARSFFLMADPDQQLDRNKATHDILRKGNRFSLMTISAASYIDPAVDRHWPLLKSRLDDGCPLRLLLLSPFCREQQVRNQRNKLSHRIDSKINIFTVLQLASGYPNVAIKLSDDNIYGAVFFSEDRLTYDPYHLGLVGPRLENRFFALDYIRPQGSMTEPALDHYSLLRSHFDYVWSELAVDLPVFLRKHLNDIADTWGQTAVSQVNEYLQSQPYA
jgi:hypothetical protein